MKYLKNYKNYELIIESKSINTMMSLFNLLINNIFSSFKSTLDLEKIFDNELGKIPFDMYDFFTDIKNLLQLGENGIKEFAINMDVVENENIISSILIKIYYDKFKRNIIDDIDNCISYLNNIKSEMKNKYIKYMIEFKKLLS